MKLNKRKIIIITALVIILSNIAPNTFSVSVKLNEEKNYEYSHEQLDTDYIYNITKSLSDIVFTEYSENEIARGRSFGTKGEHKASEILKENMTKLGLWTWKEQITNLPELLDVTSALWVNDYKIVIKNITSGTNKTVEGYIFPTSNGPRGAFNNKNHNYSFKNLKIKLKPKYPIPIGKNIRDIINKNNYVFITEEYSYNPDAEDYSIEKILKSLFSPYSDYTIFYKNVRQQIELFTWYYYYPKCQGLLKYDCTNDTYNMGGSVNNYLPIISINGTTGKEILADIENHRIDFYLNQTFNESVTSFNVIGQINGTEQDKIVIIDCLYDGWWCQATADSAIGMAMTLGVAKWFKDNNITPKYTLRFIGFGGEEHGLRGAKHYQAVHKNENIIYVFDLNQLGFSQDDPKLYLEFLGSNEEFLNNIFKIAQQANYTNRTGSAGIRKFYMPRGAPSDNQPFARKQKNCKTICFLKGYNWFLHHRDGSNHTEGDVLKYFDPVDVNVTGEIILNTIKYYTTDW